jgi:uncharacterized flavoprotein (TIGR03862 family)
MAAEAALSAGVQVDLYEAKGSLGRKFLIAGRGGLNLTHSDPPALFASRYGVRRQAVDDWLRDFGPQDLRDWAKALGVDTFVGSSGRVFPLDQKAAPLLRAWLRRLRELGLRIHVRHRWLGWTPAGELRFATPEGERTVSADATVLALGGGSWPQLGSDGAWVPLLRGRGVEVEPLAPANCGFDVDWSPAFAQRFAGAPVKPGWLALAGDAKMQQGEFVVTSHGIEGSLVYALSARIRDRIASEGEATVLLDLAPGRSVERLANELARPRSGRSLSEHLRRSAGIAGVRAGLLRELVPGLADLAAPELATLAKRAPLRLRRPRPLAEAISSAGGVALEALDQGLMLRARPGLFCAGEMLDWEAPTGGYLLTACFASGRRAGRAAALWLRRPLHPSVDLC